MAQLVSALIPPTVLNDDSAVEDTVQNKTTDGDGDSRTLTQIAPGHVSAIPSHIAANGNTKSRQASATTGMIRLKKMLKLSPGVPAWPMLGEASGKKSLLDIIKTFTVK